MFLFTIAWISLIHTLIYVIITRRSKAIMIVNLICIILLTYKIFEYGYCLIVKHVYSKIPVDYSAITYFIMPVIMLLKYKRLMPLVIFAAFLSGFGYLITFPFLGKEMITINGYYSVIMALINHSLLYIVSILTMKQYLFAEKNYKIILLGSLIMVVYSAIIYVFVDFGQSYIFIYKLLDGTYATYLFKGFKEFSLSFLFYYIFLFFTFVLCVKIFYKINEIIYNEKRIIPKKLLINNIRRKNA